MSLNYYSFKRPNLSLCIIFDIFKHFDGGAFLFYIFTYSTS